MNVFRLFLLPTIVLMLAACATAPEPPQQLTARTSTLSPRLPKGVVRTDGYGEIMAAAAGQARCVRTTPDAAAAALAATNWARAARGLTPLRTNDRLQRAAEAHACEMAMRGAMTHAGTKTTGPMARAKGQGYAPRLTAENIAAGRFDMGRVLSEWSSSPDHLSNIMIPGTQDFGIGQAVAADGKTTFWAAIYGKPKR